MEAQFQEAIAKLREDLTARLRVEEAANKKMREEAAKRGAVNRESEAKLERLRKERSLGTSFAGQGGGNSADRRGTAVLTMGPMWTRGAHEIAKQWPAVGVPAESPDGMVSRGGGMPRQQQQL